MSDSNVHEINAALEEFVTEFFQEQVGREFWAEQGLVEADG